MLHTGVKQFMQEADVDKDHVMVLTELTLQSLKERNAEETAEIDEKRLPRTGGYSLLTRANSDDLKFSRVL